MRDGRAMTVKIIEPGSALDWYTVGQLCESAARELIAEHPSNPKLGRIDLHRDVVTRGRKHTVRIKLTIAEIAER
jgi:hypothetical protein